METDMSTLFQVGIYTPVHAHKLNECWGADCHYNVLACYMHIEPKQCDTNTSAVILLQVLTSTNYFTSICTGSYMETDMSTLFQVGIYTPVHAHKLNECWGADCHYNVLVCYMHIEPTQCDTNTTLCGYIGECMLMNVVHGNESIMRKEWAASNGKLARLRNRDGKYMFLPTHCDWSLF